MVKMWTREVVIKWKLVDRIKRDLKDKNLRNLVME